MLGPERDPTKSVHLYYSKLNGPSYKCEPPYLTSEEPRLAQISKNMSRLNTDLSRKFLINAFFRDSHWTNSAWLQTLSQLNLQSISCRGDSCDIYSPPTSHPTHICISAQFNFSKKTLLFIIFWTHPPWSTQLTDPRKLKDLVTGTHLLISSPLVKALQLVASWSLTGSQETALSHRWHHSAFEQQA